MKKILMILLMIGLILVSGCVSGEIKDTINSDGTLNRNLTIDKTGYLASASCDSLKKMAENNGEINETNAKNFEEFEKVCRETDDEIIITYDLSIDDESNPVKLIEKDGEDYLRYESVRMPINTTIKMPSKITSHNGKLIDDYTVEFEAINLMTNPFDLDQTQTSSTEIFVECKKPTLTESLIGLIIGGILISIILVGGIIFFLKKRK